MQVEVLVSTMFQKDSSLLEKINIKSNAIIVNQADSESVYELKHKDNNIIFINSKERGIGRSRNQCLSLATSEYAIFADDDIVYYDNYKDIILSEFKRLEDADIVLFNFDDEDTERAVRHNLKSKKVNYFNCLRYGAVNIAINTNKVKGKNLQFSLDFGGGAKYSSGEDSLFLVDCLRKGLKIYTSTETIGKISYRKSSWFKGYDEKYFTDKGVLYYYMSSKYAYLLCLQFALRKYKMYRGSLGLIKAIRYLFEGVKVGKGEKQ